MVTSRINCTMNLPPYLMGTLKQILFALHPGFVFPSHGLGGGASACMDHLPWDTGQTRMREGKVKKKRGCGENAGFGKGEATQHSEV